MTTPLTVLVAEDNAINQKVVIKMLERLRLNAAVAQNGLEAVKLFTGQQYELVFMDIQMPEMDGLEATRQIRLMETTGPRPVIIALTANAMPGDRERCLQAGMDDYIAKPIRQTDIESIIAKWFPAVGLTIPSAGASSAQTPELIDPKRLEQIREIGDAELINELLTLFLQDMDQFAADVAAAIEAGNFRQIFESAHKLKGSSANLGIETIRESCLSLEQLAQANDGPGIASAFSQIGQRLSDVRAHIIRTYH